MRDAAPLAWEGGRVDYRGITRTRGIPTSHYPARRVPRNASRARWSGSRPRPRLPGFGSAPRREERWVCVSLWPFAGAVGGRGEDAWGDRLNGRIAAKGLGVHGRTFFVRTGTAQSLRRLGAIRFDRCPGESYPKAVCVDTPIPNWPFLAENAGMCTTKTPFWAF